MYTPFCLIVCICDGKVHQIYNAEYHDNGCGKIDYDRVFFHAGKNWAINIASKFDKKMSEEEATYFGKSVARTGTRERCSNDISTREFYTTLDEENRSKTYQIIAQTYYKEN